MRNEAVLTSTNNLSLEQTIIKYHIFSYENCYFYAHKNHSILLRRVNEMVSASATFKHWLLN